MRCRRDWRRLPDWVKAAPEHIDCFGGLAPGYGRARDGGRSVEGAGEQVQLNRHAGIQQAGCVGQALVTQRVILVNRYVRRGRPERSSARAGAA